MKNIDMFKESSKIIIKLIGEGKIIKPIDGSISFFIEKSIQSIRVSQRLYDLESDEGIITSLWVINSSYYSMFFAASALLAKSGYKINTEIRIHKLTYHALIHYFINEENKLKKELIKDYESLMGEAEELLQINELKFKEMISDFNYELNKRKKFTYELGEIAQRSKAKTSLLRAKNFVKIVELML